MIPPVRFGYAKPQGEAVEFNLERALRMLKETHPFGEYTIDCLLISERNSLDKGFDPAVIKKRWLQVFRIFAELLPIIGDDVDAWTEDGDLMTMCWDIYHDDPVTGDYDGSVFYVDISDADVRWSYEGKRNVPRMDGVTNNLKLLAEAASVAARLTRGQRLWTRRRLSRTCRPRRGSCSTPTSRP